MPQGPRNASPDAGRSSPSVNNDSPEPKRTLRRQGSASFYPNNSASIKPTNPFSRSAAKRGSVMALGSIEHLQHYFTKTGLAAKNDLMNKPHTGLVPAIGGSLPALAPPVFNLTLNDASDPDASFELPPSPTIPSQEPAVFTSGRAYKEIDPESIKPGVITDLKATARAWDITLAPNASTLPAIGSVDVLSLLKTTTRAIRSVRTYTLSLPTSDHDHIHTSTQISAASSYRARSFTPIPVSPTKKKRKPAHDEPDKGAIIRKVALEALTALRSLEERARIHLDDEAYNGGDANSDPGSIRGDEISRVASPSALSVTPSTPRSRSRASLSSSTSYTYAQSDGDVPITYSLAPNGKTVPVWDTDDTSTQLWLTEDERDHTLQKENGWDARLVVSGGWLYRQDITKEELEGERDKVKKWMDVVDETLFGGTEGGKRGWDRVEVTEKSKSKFAKDRRRSSATDGNTSDIVKPRARRVLSLGGPLHEEPDDEDDMDEPQSLWAPVRMGEDIASEIQEETSSDCETDVPDDQLPDWARRSMFNFEPIARLRSLLGAVLPPALLALLPPWTDGGQEVLLETLSSGQMLCSAYNTAVRRSRRPWGYVSRDAVHDVLGIERGHERDGTPGKDKGGTESEKKAWTFRRIDNLRLWAGALKLRYLIPIVGPAEGPMGPNPMMPVALPSAAERNRPQQGKPSPLLSLRPNADAKSISIVEPITSPLTPSTARPAVEPVVMFDPRIVARRDPGWDEMFLVILRKWMDAVVAEQRGER